MANGTCATCGTQIHIGAGRPQGEAQCRPCRRESVPHGTPYKYKRGCRCAECIESKRIETIAFRAKYEARNGKGYYDGRDRPGRPALAKLPCAICSEPVSARTTNPMHKRCRRGAHVPDDVRLAVYERDGWTCQFCIEPVNQDDKHGPWSPTLDHILHRSNGGTDDPDNLRCLHRYCNGVRATNDWLTLNDLA